MKFKFEKKDFEAWNLYFQKLIIFFWVYVSLVIFTYRKLWAEKDGKFSSHFVGL